MCDPASITSVTLALSTAFTASQQIKQGKFQKGVADYNARVAENEAEETRKAGVEQENIQRRKTAELLSKQRAQLGAANVDITSGSPLQLQEDTLDLGEADALRIRSNFENRARALETGADLTRSQGEFAESSGKNAAFGTLLAGTAAVMGTGVADKWFTPNSSANAGTGVLNTDLGSNIFGGP